MMSLAIAAAPAPKDVQPAVAVLRQAIGRSHVGKEVRAIGKRMGDDPVIHYPLWKVEQNRADDDTHFYLTWKAKGLELCFVHGNMHTARLHNSGADGVKAYRGELPDGLDYSDDAPAVEKKLGKPGKVLSSKVPAKQGDAELEEVEYLYPDKGVCVTFHRTGAGGRATIQVVALYPPGDAPCR